MSDPQQLLQEASQQLWSLLRELREELKADTKLVSLTPLPGLESTPLAGLLQPVDNLSPTSRGAVLFTFARTLVSSGSAEGFAVRVHGWDPGGGQPRSVALCAGTLEPAGDRIVIALASGDDDEVGLHVFVNTAAEITTATPTASLSVTTTPSNHGQYEGWFGPKGAKQFTGNGTVDCIVSRVENSPFVMGDVHDDSGRRIAAQRMTFSTRFTFTSEPPQAPQAMTTLLLEKLAVNVFPDWLVPLADGVIPVIEKFGVQADTQNGLHLLDGGTAVTLQANSSASGLNVQGIDVGLSAKDNTSLNLRFGLRVRVSPPGIPLVIDAAGFGAELPFSIGADNGFGFRPEKKMALLPPEAIGADLTLPFASGGGVLADFRNDSLGGAFAIDLKFVTINAFALLQPSPLSFVILMSVRFPYPGIQLGFGFSLTGIGGLVGINRRLDARAIEAAILNGNINQLLFPADPARNAIQTVETLSKIFPSQNGHFVVGPALEISWGGRLITLVVALIIDLPDPPTFTLIGRLVVALPDPVAPVVLLQTTFSGHFDPGVPIVQITGTLKDSRIVIMPLVGEALIVARGGSDPLMLISAGGFHPAFKRPPGIPALRRIGCDLSPIPWLSLRAEAYFALIASSVHFGAKIQASIGLADCGIEGWFDFNALCQWRPVGFAGSCSGSVAVEVLGESLMAVSMGLKIMGPTPWIAEGCGSVSIGPFDVSLDFRTQWGASSQIEAPQPDIEGELRAAFAEASAWTSDVTSADQESVVLTPWAGEDEKTIHPLASLRAHQQVIPLTQPLTRFQGADLKEPEQWSIIGGGLKEGISSQLGAEILDKFPTGQFFIRTEEEQLSGRAFDDYVCGKEIFSGWDIGNVASAGMPFETAFIPKENGQFGLEILNKITSPGVQSMWKSESSDGQERLKVLQMQPMTIALNDTLQQIVPSASGQEIKNYQMAVQAAHHARCNGMEKAIAVERWETFDVSQS